MCTLNIVVERNGSVEQTRFFKGDPICRGKIFRIFRSVDTRKEYLQSPFRRDDDDDDDEYCANK